MCFPFLMRWFSGSMLNFGGVITRWWFQILSIFTPKTWGKCRKWSILTNSFQMGLNHQLDNYAYIRTSSSVMIRIMDCFDPSKENLYSPLFTNWCFIRWETGLVVNIFPKDIFEDDFPFPEVGYVFSLPAGVSHALPKNQPWSLCHLPGDLQSLRSAGESRSMRRDPTKIFAKFGAAISKADLSKKANLATCKKAAKVRS